MCCFYGKSWPAVRVKCAAMMMVMMMVMKHIQDTRDTMNGHRRGTQIIAHYVAFYFFLFFLSFFSCWDACCMCIALHLWLLPLVVIFIKWIIDRIEQKREPVNGEELKLTIWYSQFAQQHSHCVDGMATANAEECATGHHVQILSISTIVCVSVCAMISFLFTDVCVFIS